MKTITLTKEQIELLDNIFDKQFRKDGKTIFYLSFGLQNIEDNKFLCFELKDFPLEHTSEDSYYNYHNKNFGLLTKDTKIIVLD